MGFGNMRKTGGILLMCNRYLWLALQLNVLFPPPNTTLVTPSDVAQLLDKPPKDLSEALNNALEKIRDTRYGN